jgi:hypothetical protein
VRRAQAVLSRGRRKANALMLDTCTVKRRTGTSTDPETGVVTATFTTVYSGTCKIQQSLSQASNPVAGEHQYTVQDTRWDTPVGSGPFAVNDVVTITAAAEDAQLVGRQFRVTELFNKSLATAQRCRVEEIT